MPASSRHTCAVTEVLNESGVVSLYPRSSRCVAVVHSTVDHVEATLPLIQSQLKVGTAAAREVLRPPLNVKDAVGSSATYRCEYAKPAVDQIQIVPVWEDRVVVGGPRQASISKRRIGSHELGVAVGRQIDRSECLVVQRVREGQRNGGHRVIPVIADVGRAWHDTPADLIDRVLTHARCRRRCRRWRSRAACRGCACCCWRRTRTRGW